jgi:large subunit ribosomal protein L6e
MFHHRGMWKLKNRTVKSADEKKKQLKASRKAKVVVKPIGGDKNGKQRVVVLKKARKHYPTEDKPKTKKTCHQKPFKLHERSLRKRLVPGTLVILLAGAHRGKRAVFLKQLATGLLLVSGPFSINGCPLRRINQCFVIATTTRVDISNVKIPDTINDKYFKRDKPKRSRAPVAGGEIFDKKPEPYVVSQQRKEDQVNVDKQLVAAIRANKEASALKHYLSTPFSLRNHQYPHAMKF